MKKGSNQRRVLRVVESLLSSPAGNDVTKTRTITYLMAILRSDDSHVRKTKKQSYRRAIENLLRLGALRLEQPESFLDDDTLIVTSFGQTLLAPPQKAKPRRCPTCGTRIDKRNAKHVAKP